jgi:hypothetical protein
LEDNYRLTKKKQTIKINDCQQIIKESDKGNFEKNIKGKVEWQV